ncbi:transcription-repair coupling factor [Treponema primitia ZAS-2]|uniref:Transcription-repair-coupling factor n=1 Tax=Treponema primitia (strain ATCC BAA-887 / DSM 12427 / ZAS-2) TaxID=545694 RepID=F5YL26_TREPZ|nr:transcription-repair coupling factor [Treponema primitia]AEF86715.1 transcription-repair coupling factor [Treponema primitia ZAS-2]
MNALSFPSFLKKIVASDAVSRVLDEFKGGKFPLEIEGAEGSFGAILLSALFQTNHDNLLAVTPSEREAAELATDLETLGVPVALFPWWGTVSYREMAPLSTVFGERTRVLGSLARSIEAGPGNRGIVVVPERAFLTPLPPPEYIRSLLITLKPGGKIDTIALAETLSGYGYIRVPRVQVHGEFALRGEVLDILMGGDDSAYRVLFDFDQVESIKRFDPVDQSSLGPGDREKVGELVIRPLKEVVWSDERIETLSRNLASFPEFANQGRAMLEELMTRRGAGGEELFFPLAFEGGAAALTDYFAPGAGVCYLERERLENAQESLEREYHSFYTKALREREVPAPERILLKFADLAGRLPRQVSFMTIKGNAETEAKRIMVSCDPPRSFFGNINYLKEEFSVLAAQGWELVVAAESETQAGRLTELFKDEKVTVAAAPLSMGFALPDSKFMLVQENEIFGRRKRPPRSLKQVRSVAIDTFVELNPGDFVVHINYGIGLFKGIERIKALGHERDYIKLEYLGEEIVFVPIEQVNLVQRYIGNEGSPPRMDKLGSKSWENRKGRVKKSVEDIAEKLIELYSKRKASRGFAFPQDSEWQTMFEAAFPFDETEDQLRCVEEIKDDMESTHPMDRLICGDVGYGKTEVAVRACFKAVMGGKQVAFLAPTTILAEQHFENFQERFSQFPIRLGMLSRFVDRAAARKTLEAVQKGEIDILVGTHRIIQKDVSFRDLGLIVIDEEQRFGVKDKERLKELKHNVDCLTLSATPIPRTLHMSLLKIRDMSLLATPPNNRHPIETVIGEYNEDRLAAAIRAEVERGGQVFFLHNRVESLNETRIRIEHLAPEMLVETAHGQMDAQDLEDVMHRFIHGGFHVLVSTTIIENGIDIPNVNTIIIDRADMYGVSQLYQLRGRVGRSDRVAYAYLFYPRDRALSELAMKRLQVISDFTELGSGFKIAMKDMEIRGAGNLLGREQSGDIYSVGFDLYLRLLDDAVRRLENSQYEAETETLLELEYTGFIPDFYIDGAQEKMEVYKKIAAVKTRDELESLHGELMDRFGPPPDEAASLLALAEIRIICRDISVFSLRERGGSVKVEFGKVSRVKIDRLLRLMKESSGRVKLDPKAPNVLILQTGSIGLKEKSEFIREKLAALAG